MARKSIKSVSPMGFVSMFSIDEDAEFVCSDGGIMMLDLRSPV